MVNGMRSIRRLNGRISQLSMNLFGDSQLLHLRMDHVDLALYSVHLSTLLQGRDMYQAMCVSKMLRLEIVSHRMTGQFETLPNLIKALQGSRSFEIPLTINGNLQSIL
jgi:hypothetical protein